MRSPFPGMDPFIESRGLWGDFHDSLIAEIKRNLANALPERYVVRISERSYIDYINPREAERTTIPMKPDVTLHSTSAALETASQLAGTALAEEDPQSLIMHGLVEVEERETFLEIRELDPELRLVTCIEVLSPSNKRYGSVGWYQYQQKRQVFVQGHANLVELDLLRAG